MNHSFDIVIAGGGMAGASMAVALSGRGLRIAVVEAVDRGAALQPSYDDRTLSLAHASCEILRTIGVWQDLVDVATPIRRIEVSSLGQFGRTRLDAETQGLEAFGHVVVARELGAALEQRLSGCDDVTVYRPAVVMDVTPGVSLTVRTDHGDQELCYRLLVAADGIESTVRTRLGIEVDCEEYGQVAVITNVTPGQPHCNTAFERLTESGPLALLPLTQRRCGVVWCLPEGDEKSLMAVSDEEFLEGLQSRFGYSLGRFERAGRRACYPLRLVRAQVQTALRTLLVGNAAHAIHPVSAQGLNLGLRDIAAVAELVVEAVASRRDVGGPELLADYDAWRKPDHRQIINWSDGLVRLFRNPFGPVRRLRSAAMVGIDLLPPLQQRLTRMTMGLNGRVPKLARGERL